MPLYLILLDFLFLEWVLTTKHFSFDFDSKVTSFDFAIYCPAGFGRSSFLIYFASISMNFKVLSLKGHL